MATWWTARTPLRPSGRRPFAEIGLPPPVPDAFRALIGLSLEETARHLLLPGVGLLLPLLNTGTGEAHPCMNVLQGGKRRSPYLGPGRRCG